MFDAFLQAVTAFLTGKLFREQRRAYGRIALGSAVSLAAFFGAAAVLPVWGAALAAGLIGGGVQPLLLKDVRYR